MMTNFSKVLCTVLLFVMPSVWAQQSLPSMVDVRVDKLHDQPIKLPRPSIERIQKKRIIFRQKIERTEKIVNSLYFAGGVLTGALALYVTYYLVEHFSSTPAHSVPHVSASRVLPVDQNVLQQTQLAYLQHKFGKKSFWENIKKSVNSGATLALATFVAGVVLNAFSYCEGASLEHIKKLLSQDDLWFYQSIRSDLGINVAQFEKTLYAFIKDLAVMLNDAQSEKDKDSFKQFQYYFNGDLVVDYSALVSLIEDLMAIALESIEAYPPDYRKKMASEIEETLMQLFFCVDEFALYLETLLQQDQPFDLKLAQRTALVNFKKLLAGIICSLSSCGTLLYGHDGHGA